MPPLEPIFITGCRKSDSYSFPNFRQHKDLTPTTGYPMEKIMWDGLNLENVKCQVLGI